VAVLGETPVREGSQPIEPDAAAAAVGTGSGTGPSPGAGAPRLAHQPALDGLRGLAVGAVLLFHLERLEGGFLGVDLFFGLSGFLITSLLLVEHRVRGRIDLGRFWVRRARRLLPAVFVLMVGVAFLLVRFTPADQRPRFRGDALATLGYVANWHRLVSGVSYWEIFSQPSPLDHTWSLAIEEQFYVFWPLVLTGVLALAARARRSDRVVTGLALAGAAVSFVLMAVLYDPLDTSRAYFGTDSRIGATLLGAALAGVTAGRERAAVTAASTASGAGAAGPSAAAASTASAAAGPAATAGAAPAAGPAAAAEVSPGSRRPSRLIGLAGAVGLAWMAWSVTTVDGVSPWYYRGGLVLFALAAVAVILAATRVDGAVGVDGRVGLLGRLLGFKPLRLLGLISYGVYLWHWPINVYVDADRAGFDGWKLDLLRLALTIGVSTLSYVAIEQPIRRGALRGWSVRVAGAGALAVSLVAVLVATSGTPAESVDEARGFGPLPLEGSDNPYLLYPSSIPDGAMRVLLVGDSGAHNLGPRLAAAAGRYDAVVASSAPYYCNVMAPEGVQKLPDGTAMDRGDCHSRRLSLWSDFVDEYDPDVVVYYLANAGAPGEVLIDGEWSLDCRPRFDDYLADALRSEARLLGRRGALVVLATSPYSRIPDPDANARIDCRNQTYRDVAASQPGVAIADMNAFFEQQTEVPYDGVFMDMVHLSVEGGDLASAWLLPELHTLVDEATGAGGGGSGGGGAGTAPPVTAAPGP
jgi:peptidoglycan/LPS O-acetylase OafA/YrhL